MEIFLSELYNVKAVSTSTKRNDFRSIYSLLCGIVNEYAVSVLKKKEGDSTYGYIMSYSSGIDLSAKSLFKECYLEDSEMMEIVKKLDFCEDVDKWNELSKKIKWISDEKENRYYIDDFSFSSPKIFLNLIKENDNYIAQELRIDQEKDEFIAIKNIENVSKVVTKATSTYYSLINKKSKSLDEYKDYSETYHVDKDKFFTLTEDLKAADEDQRESISADTDKNLLVIAGAGSGKTRSLVGRLTYLHLVKGIPLHKILLLTFTRAAASEMGNRGKEQISKAYLNTGCIKEEKPFVNASTIDAFFKRIVEKYYVELGLTQKPTFLFDRNDIKKRSQLLANVIRENHLENVFNEYRSWEGLEALLLQIENYINGLTVNISGIENLVNLFIEKQIRTNTIVSFSCEAYVIKKCLSDSTNSLYNRICDNYDCILIDEFQDINGLQNEVLSYFYNSRIHFTFVGDDDQTIYTWRGADNSIIKSFANDSRIKTVYLTTNYRNNPYIVKAGNDILASLEDRAKSGHIIKPAKQSGSKVLLTQYDSNYENLAHEVLNVYRNKKPGEKICILYREDKKTKRTENDEKQELGERQKLLNTLSIEGVPYVTREEISSDFGKGYSLLKAILYIQNKIDVKDSCLIIKDMTGVDETTTSIKRIVLGSAKNLPEETTGEDISLLNVYKLAESVNKKLNYANGLSEVISNYNRTYAEQIEGNAKIDRKIENNNLIKLQEYCNEFSLTYPLAKDKLKSFFAGFEERIAKKQSKIKTTPNDKESADDVVVTTIHNAKGLEYDTVFIIGLNDGDYPNTKRIISEYNKKIDELKRLERSRDNLKELRHTITNDTIDGLLKDCDENNWTGIYESEKEVFKQLAFDIEAYRDDYRVLNEDGVDAYIDSFCSYVKNRLDTIEDTKIQKAKEIFACRENADEKEEKYSELDEDTEEYKKLYDEWNDVNNEISIKENTLKEIEDSQSQYLAKISNLVRFYDICNSAKAFLYEIRKLSNQQDEIAKLEKERKDKELEEKRIFYVAVSRAINRLYLCNESGFIPSPFISLINPDNCQRYTMHTFGQEEEIKRMQSTVETVREEIKKQEETLNVKNNKAIDDGIKEILNTSKDIKTEMEEYVKEYKNRHTYLQGLEGNSKFYIDNAIGLMAMAEKLGYNFDTEILHNLQRFAEVFIKEKIGEKALPYKTDEITANSIALDIRNIAQKLCKTQKPGEGYITELLSNTDRKFRDELDKCKNLAIECYVVCSKKYSIDSEIISSWKTKVLRIPSDKFLGLVIDLSNIRNDAIHNGQASFKTDYIPYSWEITENIIKAFSIEDIDYKHYEKEALEITNLNEQGKNIVEQIKRLLNDKPNIFNNFIQFRNMLNDYIKSSKISSQLCAVGEKNILSIKEGNANYKDIIKDVYINNAYSIADVVASIKIWRIVFGKEIKALICPECKSVVELNANCCPKCGCPIDYIKNNQ